MQPFHVQNPTFPPGTPPPCAQECPEGTYTEMTGSTSQAACVPAPAGNYAAGTGNDGFTPCDPGTYQDQPGKASCKDCPPGYACPAGSVNPIPCSKGFYADLKQPWCKECAKGTYQDQTAQRACKPCPAGAYCAATKMVAPTPCPAGRFGIKFSSVTANDCAKCPINVRTHQNGGGGGGGGAPDQWSARSPAVRSAIIQTNRWLPIYHVLIPCPPCICRPSPPAPAPPPALLAQLASGPAASTASRSVGPPPSACRKGSVTRQLSCAPLCLAISFFRISPALWHLPISIFFWSVKDRLRIACGLASTSRP